MTLEVHKTEARSAEAWERAWRKHWQKVGSTPYELKPSQSKLTHRERSFLIGPRTLAREQARLERIRGEFEHGFGRLRKLGPAVTGFGSARFQPGHPYYELYREVAGHQGYGSLSRRLVEGSKSVSIYGDKIVFRASIHTLGRFSAQAGRSDLLKWFSTLAPSQPQVILTHGEDTPRKALGPQIQQRNGWPPRLPVMGEVVVLE